jgi:hypothetical protein
MRQSLQRLAYCASILVCVPVAISCGGPETVEPPLATPSVVLNHERAPAGSPLEITYRFDVAADANIDEDYWVMAHVVDTDEELMWTDDHLPPTPTSQWAPGETIEYTRTIFVPIFPYIGEAALHVGLYRCAAPPDCSDPNDRRFPLSGEDVGQFAYRVARLSLAPQTDNLFAVFKDGWHPAEVAGDDATIEWQWSKQEATLAFRNPMKDAILFLDADNPGGSYIGPSTVQIKLGGEVVEEFVLEPEERVLRKVRLPADQLGSEEMSELTMSVDKTFVPAETPAAGSSDPRELGLRVFHAFVDPR